ncbi:MAG: hypothetical protein Q8J71_01705, partial [Brevundimonas sp.]|nr:hypothetical protein [Brevundimonas sp.]
LKDLLAAGKGLGQTLHLENILLRHGVRRALSSGVWGRLARGVAAAPLLGKCLGVGEGGLMTGQA